MIRFRFKVAFVASILFVPALFGCTKKQEGFGLPGSSIRYQTTKFEDPAILARLGELSLTRSQVLDKSVVVQDLIGQINDAKIGLSYIKVLDRLAGGESKKEKLEFVSLRSVTPLERILAPFGREPSGALSVVYPEHADPKSPVVARFRGKELTADEIGFAHFRLQMLEHRLFEETARQLNSQLARILLAEEASRENIGLQDYIDKNVFSKGAPSASAEEILAYAKSIGLSEAELTDDLKVRFGDLLKSRRSQAAIEAYVAKNRLSSRPVEVSFEQPTFAIPLNREWSPIEGLDDAPVSVVVFSGLTCPDCVPFARAFVDVVEEFAGHLRINWIHNFDVNDGMAQLMAESALCAEAMKRGASFRFIDEFSRPSAELNENAFYAWVKDSGLDEGSFKACVTEGKMKDLVRQHLDYARAAGVVANPTIWAEGEAIEGAISREALTELFRRKVETSGSTTLGAWWRRLRARIGF